LLNLISLSNAAEVALPGTQLRAGNCQSIFSCINFLSYYEDRRKTKVTIHSPVNMADKGGRQRPGFACEECRRRKARCDRARPACGQCLESSTLCIVPDKKLQRGPKKGRINAMRSQIGLCHPYPHFHTHTHSLPTVSILPHTHTNECVSMRHS
jgi:hypothetical protein